MTLVAIHQPNFFPWLGYFDKIVRCQKFILLDHVQIQKKGGSWCNRVKLLIAGEERWVTAPLAHNFHGVRAVSETMFQPINSWREKFLRSLAANYAHAPFFHEIMGFLEPLILRSECNVARYNGEAVICIAGYLGLPLEKFHWSSEIGAVGRSNEMLISLVKNVGGDVYMCGDGAEGYQQDSAFAAAGIGMIYQNFRHPIYPQVGTKEFVSGLSVIDALMNIGVHKVRDALNIA